MLEPEPARDQRHESLAPARPARRRWSLSATAELRTAGLGGMGATSIALVARLAGPFERGIWLVAYLLLVGSVAPLLLATGESIILAGRSPRPTDPQAALWLLGTAAVPAGVLADMRLLVAIGSAALLIALACIVRASFAGRPARPVIPAPILWAHFALIASWRSARGWGCCWRGTSRGCSPRKV